MRDGLCECGCKGLTAIVKRTDAKRGNVKGQPVRFIKGHSGQTNLRGAATYNWKGGRIQKGSGYIVLLMPDHPRVTYGGYVYEHLVIAEHALGRPLPPGVEVHHVNEKKSENQNTNLVICENRTYHVLLHRRARAYRATGSVLGVKCRYCQRWGLPGDADMHIIHRPDGNRIVSYHRACRPPRPHGGKGRG